MVRPKVYDGVLYIAVRQSRESEATSGDPNSPQRLIKTPLSWGDALGVFSAYKSVQLRSGDCCP